MAPRPNWKGFLKLSLVSCSISLYPATSGSERVSFNQINKNTGNRIRYKKVDGDTGEEVNQSDIIKGYQIEKNVYVTVEDEELEALQVDSSHTIEIDKFSLSRTSTSGTSTRPTTSSRMTRSARMHSPSSATR
jgi:DNA end-binding protein Ku